MVKTAMLFCPFLVDLDLDTLALKHAWILLK
jgi:hypothetical protein